MNIAEIKCHYSIHSDDQSHIICKLIDRLERAETALKNIDASRNSTQLKGRFHDLIGAVDEDGFVPMPPSVRDGLLYNANIARETLEK